MVFCIWNGLSIFLASCYGNVIMKMIRCYVQVGSSFLLGFEVDFVFQEILLVIVFFKEYVGFEKKTLWNKD